MLLYDLNEGRNNIAGASSLHLDDSYLAEIEITGGGLAMSPLRCGRTVGVAIVNPPPDAVLFERLLAEVAPFTLHTDGRVKKPFEMTQTEWGSVNLLHNASFRIVPLFQHNENYDLGGTFQANLTCLASQKLIELLGYGVNCRYSNDSHDHNNRHEVHVAYALLEGKPVPDSVLAEYPDAKSFGFDMSFTKALLAYPELRGIGSSSQNLMYALNMVCRECPLTRQLIDKLIPLIVAMPAKCPPMEVDNLLYAAGIRENTAETYKPAETPVPWLNDFAKQHAEAIAFKKSDRLYAAAKADVEKGFLSKRRLERQLAYAEWVKTDFGFKDSNRFALALSRLDNDLDLPYLLGRLDTSSGNETSQRLVEQHFMIKLRNVSAASRRAAVYGLFASPTGIDVAELEKQILAKTQAFELRTDLRHAREKASSVKVVYKGLTMTAADFVDKLLGEGYSQMQSTKVGAATRHILCCPLTGQGFKMSKANGTLEYAKLLLLNAGSPAPTPQSERITEAA